ncbi:uncharacterized protein LOC114647400 [Erpetoichthys calabaricus]|uniref:uncharacterized protein LOC114647400 n=1 Tax=Erpetoichthys calabaricus TaxID=27687 RepID=UPI0022343B3E|nr:uncharacterized protein LOC114647400 [Erpetoichthys calabaricus]XP_051779367.1 uncharacterized protein LOC114647400 [Erpetoichthys calabaricus]
MERIVTWTTFPILLLSLGVTVTDADDLQLVGGNVYELVNMDIILKCVIKNMPTSVRMENMGVVWTKTVSNNQTSIYTFQAGRETPQRNGTYMDKDKLLEGDASLHLRNVQFDDEGQYKCVVYITPVKGELQFLLEVSDRPRVDIEPKETEVLIGNERSIVCRANNFYPNKIDIKWIKVKGGVIEPVTDNVCTGSPTMNDKGIFDISSRIIIKPVMEDNGNVYRCEVFHRTFEGGFSVESTLRVKEPEESSNALMITGILITILCLLGITAFLLYLKLFKPIAPQVTELQTPDTLKHKEQSLLSVLVSGFRPRNIKAILYLKRASQQPIQIFWYELEQKKPINILKKKTTDEVRVPLNINGNESVTDDSFKANIKEGKAHGDSTYSFTLIVTTFPDIYKDNGAVLTLEIQHSSSKKPIEWKRKINVIGVKPRLNQILVPPILVHGDLVALTCPINGFKPRPLIITWYKQELKGKEKKKILCVNENGGLKHYSNDVQKKRYSHSISEMVDETDHTYDVISVLTFIPSVSDDDQATFICEVEHIDTNYTVKQERVIHVKATPKLDSIQLVHDSPVAGASMGLTCRIHSYYPQTSLEVFWYLDDTRLVSIDVGDTTRSDDELYYCTSSVKTIPYWEDVGKVFKCLVKHESLPVSRETKWTLDELVSLPKVYEILSNPKLPELGKPLTLCCVVSEFYPKDCDVVWVRGYQRMEDGTKTEEPELDNITKLYSRKTQRTFYPVIEDLGSEFTVEMTHRGVTHRPEKDLFVMKFKGIPTVSAVTKDTSICNYGHPVKLSCDVTGFLPKDITAEWRQDGRTITEGVEKVYSDGTDEHGCYSLSSTLDFIPTAYDFNKDYYFFVRHQKLKEPVERRAEVSLSVRRPVISEIVTNPQVVQFNRKVRLSINIEDFSPQDITVMWKRADKELKGTLNKELNANKLLNAESWIEFFPRFQDQACNFQCEVQHLFSKFQKKKEYVLLVKGCPYVSDIVSSSSEPAEGQKVTLTCDISQFSPKEIEVSWLKDGKPVKSGMSTSQPAAQANSTYNLTTKLVVTAEKNGGLFSVLVKHPTLGDETIKLDHRMTVGAEGPTGRIRCLQKRPKAGEDVTLHFDFQGDEAEKDYVTWFKNKKPLNSDLWNCVALEDDMTFRTTITFKTSPEESECEIRCEINDGYFPVEETMILKLF